MRPSLLSLKLAVRLAGRDLTETARSPVPYAVASLSAIAATLVLRSHLATFASESVFVTADPALLPLALALGIAAIYLTIGAAGLVAGEREHRTLEVLFTTPATPYALILAKFMWAAALLFALTAAIVFQVAAAGFFTNLGGGAATALSALIVAVAALPCPAVGLLVSVWMRRARTAVAVAVLLLACPAAADVAGQWLAAIPPSDLALWQLYIREGLVAAIGLLGWLSPMGAMMRAMEWVNGTSVHSLSFILGIAFGYTATVLFISTFSLARRGGLP